LNRVRVRSDRHRRPHLLHLREGDVTSALITPRRSPRAIRTISHGFTHPPRSQMSRTIRVVCPVTCGRADVGIRRRRLVRPAGRVRTPRLHYARRSRQYSPTLPGCSHKKRTHPCLVRQRPSLRVDPRRALDTNSRKTSRSSPRSQSNRGQDRRRAADAIHFAANRQRQAAIEQPPGDKRGVGVLPIDGRAAHRTRSRTY